MLNGQIVEMSLEDKAKATSLKFIVCSAEVGTHSSIYMQLSPPYLTLSCSHTLTIHLTFLYIDFHKGTNVAMAIKLLYEMSGALPRVCAALVADLSTHNGALETSPLQGQVTSHPFF